MISADSEEINKLFGDLGFSLIAPAFVLVFGFGNSRLPWNRQSRGLRVRLTLTLAILFFVFTICTLMVQDRATLAGLWHESPFLCSIIYLVVVVLSIAGISGLVYWKLRPRMWHDDARI